MIIHKAAVIIPPLQDFYTTPHRISFMGAEVVRRILLKNGIDARIIDGLEKGRRNVTIPLPAPLSYLREHLIENEKGKCSFFTQFKHFGRTNAEIVEMVRQFNPEICLISCFAFCYSTPVIELSRVIREMFPHMIITVGGAGVSVYSDFFLRCPSIDYTLCGEAEICLAPFIDYLRAIPAIPPETVYGLGWKKGEVCTIVQSNKVTASEEIQPVVTETFHNDRRAVFAASLSRGCPARCRFCSNHLVHGKAFRHISVNQFEEQLRKLPDFSPDHEVAFNFEDDNLLYDFTFLRSVLDKCASRFGRFGFTFENGIDYRLLSPQQCEMLIRAGCRQLNFSLASLKPEILEKQERVLDLERYGRLLSIAERSGIPVITYVICGFTEDTKESIARNLCFLSDKRTIIGLSLFYPVPGIHGFEDRSVFNSMIPQCCSGATAYPWGGSLSTGTLITAFRLARLLNLMKSPVKNGEESCLIDLTIRSRKLHTIIDDGERRIIPVPNQDVELVRMVLAEVCDNSSASEGR